MTLRLNGTTGYVELEAPATAGSNTLVLPTGNGSADQALVTNGSGTLSFADRGRMVLETAKASTSGTSVDFTGIPSWAKRITVMFQGVSTSSTSRWQIQLGTGAGPTFTTSGYIGYSFNTSTTTVAGGSITSGVPISNSPLAAGNYSGIATIATLGSNSWAVTSYLGGDNNQGTGGGGSIALGAVLTAVRITTVNGTDTFDAGTINIMYEG
jgi:hypothetical protein